MSRILVSVLAWDDAAHTSECIEHLLAGDHDGFDVALTDNGSCPAIAADLQALAALHPARIRLSRSDVNLGFAGGHDAALANVDLDTYTHVFLLNNDAAIAGDALLRLLEVADEENADIAGPTIVYADTPDTIWQGGGVVIDALCHVHNPWLGRAKSALPDHPVRVDFISGCAMLIRTRLIREIGFLDTAYVYSVEDMDLCTRARRAGARIVFVPTCVVTHRHAASVGGWHSPFAIRHTLWGRAYYASKLAPPVTRVLSWVFLWCVVLPWKVARATTTHVSRARVLSGGVAALVKGALRRPLPVPRAREDTRR